MTEHTFCVMLQIKTTDPRLSDEAMGEMQHSGIAADTAKMRHLIMGALPQDVERVIAAFTVEHAQLLMALHKAAGEGIAKRLRESGAVPDATSPVTRPPADYIPPTRD